MMHISIPSDERYSNLAPDPLPRRTSPLKPLCKSHLIVGWFEEVNSNSDRGWRGGLQ